MIGLKSITARNYRCLRDLTLPCESIQVLFGPNGVGKTTLLDAVWFLRDCAIRGTDQAASDRHHGVGVLWDGAEPEDRLEIALETEDCAYSVSFGFSSGRIEPFVGERLVSTKRNRVLIDRRAGSAEVLFFHEQLATESRIPLHDPERLAFSNYQLFCRVSPEVARLDDLLRAVHYYHARSFEIGKLRRFGAEASHHCHLWDRWQNLWSALRNLHGQQAVDDRYGRIVAYMREAFPGAFRDLVFEPFGDRIHASFVETGLRRPIQASGVSDGHIQFLGLVTALFGEPRQRPSLLIFDEPETSLHPHAIAVFAKAVKEAATDRNRQVLLATHSPVLMSQFEPEQSTVLTRGSDRETRATRLSQMPEIGDLLETYAVGSLYMAEAVAAQSAGAGHE